MNKVDNRSLNIGLVLIVLAALVYFIVRLIPTAADLHIPPEFLEARTRGSVFAEKIVSLNQDSLSRLGEIAKADQEGRYSSGIDLIIGELAKNEIAHQEAIGLSAELGIMAEALEAVSPEAAVNVGTQAVLQQAQIVQRLLNYNGYVHNLLAVLRERFENKGATGAEEVGVLLEKLNEEAEAINKLNIKYAELMAEFDNMTSI